MSGCTSLPATDLFAPDNAREAVAVAPLALVAAPGAPVATLVAEATAGLSLCETLGEPP
jgi:hypothetical protein